MGVVTGDQPDALCHAGVRARSAGIPLACCLEADQLSSMRSLQGQLMALHISQVQSDPIARSPATGTLRSEIHKCCKGTSTAHGKLLQSVMVSRHPAARLLKPQPA